MRMRLGLNRYGLTVQMVVSFVALVLLTAVAAGLPAVRLIRSQVEQQAWQQVNQGSHATQALYLTWRSKVEDLATLTAQRPTLQTLMAQEETDSLTTYLQTLLRGAGLDAILVCDVHGRPIAAAGEALQEATWCGQPAAAQYHLDGEAVWLTASQPIGDTAVSPGVVAVGVRLDDVFVQQLSVQTGLGHTLLWQGQPLVSGLAESFAAWEQIEMTAAETAVFGAERAETWRGDGRFYYAAYLPLNGSGLQDAIALDVTAMTQTQRRLLWSLAVAIGAVALLGSVLGAYLARRIGRPLRQLADAAARIDAGNLDTSLAVPSSVYDVTLVSQALETARVGLQQTVSEMQRARAWSDHLLDAIVEGIVTLDHDGRITFFSSGAERIFGLNTRDVLGRSCNEVFQPADTDEPFERFIPAPDRQRKIVMALANGRQATLSVTGARLTPPNAVEAGVALVFRDVSDADMMQRLMGQFMANITHEFRTPLSALAASTELLRDRAPALSAGELYELLTSLYLGIVGLQTLVDNLLESASLEAGRFRIYARPTDLGEIISDATHMMQPLLEKYGQWLEISLPGILPTVHADPRRVVQVLVNLLSNAVKYSPDGAAITLEVVVEDDLVRVSVADRGPGVAAGFRPNLFRRFVTAQTDESKSQYGAGLGLFVVKAIVEAHGGRVEVTDRAGGGSVFWFTLPLATAVAQMQNDAPGAQNNGNNDGSFEFRGGRRDA